MVKIVPFIIFLEALSVGFFYPGDFARWKNASVFGGEECFQHKILAGLCFTRQRV